MGKKFIRQEGVRYARLGKNRKSIQTWRKPKGRDSKMRLRIKGHGPSPSVGYKTARKDSGKINGVKPVLVYNVNDLSKVDKNSLVIIASVGAKKKMEIIKEAEKHKIKVLNLSGEKK